MSNSQVHAAVLRFLLQNGYRETQEAFVREAGDLIDFASVEDAPPLHRLFTRDNNDEDQQLADRMTTSLRFERPEELDEGDNDYYTTLTDTLSDIHTTNVLAVAVEPQTKMIATSSTDKSVKLTNLKDRNTERTYRHHQAPVLSIDFHPITPHFMLTTSMDGTSVLVDTRVHADGSSDPTTGVHQRFKDHQKYVVRGIFSKDGQYIATASYDRSICIYAQREERYELVRKLDNFIGNVETICFLPNHVLVAGVTGDNYIHYIDIDNDFARERYNMNANADDWVSFSPMWISPSPDGKYLLCSTSHQSGRTILFATHDSRQIQNYYDAPTDNQFVTRRHCWHPSGRYFYASGGDDNNIRVIETKTGRVAARLAGHNAMVRTMTLDPQIGLVTGGYDHLVNVWSKPIQSIIR